MEGGYQHSLGAPPTPSAASMQLRCLTHTATCRVSLFSRAANCGVEDCRSHNRILILAEYGKNDVYQYIPQARKLSALILANAAGGMLVAYPLVAV